MILNNVNINNILFIDIETVPIAENFNQINENLKSVLIKQYQREIDRDLTNNLTFDDLYNKYGGIKSEYSKVICIGLAYLHLDNNELKLKTKTIGCSKNPESEKQVLNDFANLINLKFSEKELIFCGHNIQEFDIPLLSRRMLINGIKIPPKMNYQLIKTYNVKILDTMKLWSFGDYKNFVSLEMLCILFNIPTPKQELSGDKVKEAFYINKEYEKISKYCIADVIATAQLLLKYNNENILNENQII